MTANSFIINLWSIPFLICMFLLRPCLSLSLSILFLFSCFAVLFYCLHFCPSSSRSHFLFVRSFSHIISMHYDITMHCNTFYHMTCQFIASFASSFAHLFIFQSIWYIWLLVNLLTCSFLPLPHWLIHLLAGLLISSFLFLFSEKFSATHAACVQGQKLLPAMGNTAKASECLAGYSPASTAYAGLFCQNLGNRADSCSHV